MLTGIVKITRGLRSKDQYLFGENPGQIYKAPEELKQLVLELRGGLR
jgi:hypothetical protein